jgi:flagellar basal body-associated protein FliL
MTVNLEDAKDLEDKSNKIKEGADIFQKEAGKVKRATWWQNCKWLIILIIVIVLLLVIILPISFSVGKKDDKEKKEKKRFLFEYS